MGLLFMNRLNELSGMVAESAREVWMKWNSDERRARDSTLDGAFWGRITEIMEMLISDEMDDWENAQFVKLMVSSDGLIKVEEGYLRNMKGEGAKCALFRDSDLGDLGRKVNRWRSLNRRAQ
ncbi:hypothetical protein BJ508DRAFT_419149 [Ascobolus immersus RN42]|uniref:Uncharacterized protein n=1 Tax=Ascobolus immersus RN42 TaxID=1160509 RepID=A0A3N4HMW7_ASCIM|nr:hypothetical protein BJ508DRAFT_419149 [Ascobolus immersus RN42]